MSFKYELLKKLVVAAGLKKRWISSATVMARLMKEAI